VSPCGLWSLYRCPREPYTYVWSFGKCRPAGCGVCTVVRGTPHLRMEFREVSPCGLIKSLPALVQWLRRRIGNRESLRRRTSGRRSKNLSPLSSLSLNCFSAESGIGNRDSYLPAILDTHMTALRRSVLCSPRPHELGLPPLLHDFSKLLRSMFRRLIIFCMAARVRPHSSAAWEMLPPVRSRIFCMNCLWKSSSKRCLASS
jgi:hypothetical protein